MITEIGIKLAKEENQDIDEEKLELIKKQFKNMAAGKGIGAGPGTGLGVLVALQAKEPVAFGTRSGAGVGPLLSINNGIRRASINNARRLALSENIE